MDINIQATDFKASNRLKKFVKSHVEKLKTMNDHIIEGHVCLKVANDATNENNVCEIKLAIPGNDLFASKRGKSVEESVIKTVEALKHQLDRVKTNRNNKRGDNGLQQSLDLS
jgi:putative sigma-54 modulation protein